MRSYDESRQSVIDFKKDIQDTQKKILALFSTGDKTLIPWQEKLKLFNAMIQREIINFDFETDEDTSELFDHLKNQVDEIMKDDLSINQVLKCLLDWYKINLFDILLEKKEEEILYKSRDKILKEEEIERERLEKRVKEIKKDVEIFNNQLRKTHKNYQIIDLHFDQDEKKIIRDLIQEENYFEWMVENSEIVQNYKKNFDILKNRLIALKEEVNKLSDAFIRKQATASVKRLVKINEKLGKKNEYKVDVYFLKEFLESKNPGHQDIIEKYRRIQEKNIGYSKICEIKKETDKLEEPLNTLITNINAYYQSATYYDWACKIVWPSALQVAVSKIYDELKIATTHFKNESRSLKVMQHMQEPYEVIRQHVPQFNTIVENEFFEMASIFTKELYEKTKSFEALKKLELESRAGQEKERNQFLLPIKIEVDVDDIDPLLFKELHRRELDRAWVEAFQIIFTMHTKNMISVLNELKIEDPDAIQKIKVFEENLYSIKNKIAEDLISIKKDENKNKIENLLSDFFSKLEVLKIIKKMLGDFLEMKYESKSSKKIDEIPLYIPHPKPLSKLSFFFQYIWNGIKKVFSQIFCCFSFCRKLDRPDNSENSFNGSYKMMLSSPMGKTIVKPGNDFPPEIEMNETKASQSNIEMESKEICPPTIASIKLR